jgi:hypothetical protein
MKKLLTTICIQLILTITISSQTKTHDSFNQATDGIKIHKGYKGVNLSTDYYRRYTFHYYLTNLRSDIKSKNNIQIEYEYGVEDNLSLNGFLSYSELSIGIPFLYRDLILTNSTIDTSGLVDLINSPECLMDQYKCSAAITEKIQVYTFGGKLKYHHSFLKSLNTYVLISFGYNLTIRETTIDPLISGFVNEDSLDIIVKPFTYSAGIGIRYFITSKLGVWGELGTGNTNHINIGFSYNI